MLEDCSAGFAVMPIIMIFVFVSILSRALRGASRGGGGHTSYGGTRYRTYGSGYYAAQYLVRQASYRASQPAGYSSPSPPHSTPSAYRAQTYQSPTGQPAYGQPVYRQPPYGQPAYGPPAYAQPQQYPQQPSYPAYRSGQYGSGFAAAPAPAYSTGQPAAFAPPAPVPESPKKPCNYCGSLNPGIERNCLLCGAPIK